MDIPDEYKEHLNNIGEKIKKKREKKGWSQKELAEKAGYSENYINLIENGKRIPHLKTILDIANVFGVTLRTLLREYK